MRNSKLPMCMVFGSNEAGIHGAGAAKYAEKHHAARHGCGFGYCSKSEVIGMDFREKVARVELVAHSFAVPTKDYNIETLPLARVGEYVGLLLDFATVRQDLDFQITQIGCGLAGFTPKQIAPMFYGKYLDNLYFDEAWKAYLPESAKFWGTK